MADSELTHAVEQLKIAVLQQNHFQREVAASNRALTEMLGHTIDALNEMNANLARTTQEERSDEDDIQF